MKDIYEELTSEDSLEIKKHVFGVLIADIKAGANDLASRLNYDSDKRGVQEKIARYQEKAQEWMIKLGEKLSQTNTTIEDLKSELEKRGIENAGELISIVEHSFLTKVAKNEVGENQTKRKARVL
jgi:CII-binding regulator of phage lambda lysogenization HflD